VGLQGFDGAVWVEAGGDGGEEAEIGVEFAGVFEVFGAKGI
jgi:hypothetical protein